MWNPSYWEGEAVPMPAHPEAGWITLEQLQRGQHAYAEEVHEVFARLQHMESAGGQCLDTTPASRPLPYDLVRDYPGSVLRMVEDVWDVREPDPNDTAGWMAADEFDRAAREIGTDHEGLDVYDPIYIGPAAASRLGRAAILRTVYYMAADREQGQLVGVSGAALDPDCERFPITTRSQDMRVGQLYQDDDPGRAEIRRKISMAHVLAP
jgi:hypothetical protein